MSQSTAEQVGTVPVLTHLARASLIVVAFA